MRINGSAVGYARLVSRTRVFGAVLAGAFLITGCGMVTVVSEEAVSD